ncbi:hypothetical protein D3C87_856160 [compost metagenome]
MYVYTCIQDIFYKISIMIYCKMEDTLSNIIEYGEDILVDKHVIINRILHYKPQINFKHEVHIRFYKQLAMESKYIDIIRDPNVTVSKRWNRLTFFNLAKHETIPLDKGIIEEDDFVIYEMEYIEKYYHEYMFYKYCYNPIYKINECKFTFIQVPYVIKDWMKIHIESTNVLEIMEKFSDTDYDTMKWTKFLDKKDLVDILRNSIIEHKFLQEHLNGIEHKILQVLSKTSSYLIEESLMGHIVISNLKDEIYNDIQNIVNVERIDSDALQFKANDHQDFMKNFINLYIIFIDKKRYSFFDVVGMSSDIRLI